MWPWPYFFGRLLPIDQYFVMMNQRSKFEDSSFGTHSKIWSKAPNLEIRVICGGWYESLKVIGNVTIR